MDIQYRKIEEQDRLEVTNMIRVFYNSDALYTNGSEEIYQENINNCINNSPYLEGYVFCDGNNIVGYSMLAKSYSTEFGKKCIWLEDLYLKETYRGLGIIPEFISYIKHLYPDKILRLEVEKENTHAIHVYEKADFKNLPYLEYFYIK